MLQAIVARFIGPVGNVRLLHATTIEYPAELMEQLMALRSEASDAEVIFAFGKGIRRSISSMMQSCLLC